MGRLCIVKCCPNSKLSTKGQQKIHTFPDETHEVIRTSWIQSLKVSPDSKFQHFGVCSFHFLNSDYEVSRRGKQKLSKNAVPILVGVPNTGYIQIAMPRRRIGPTRGQKARGKRLGMMMKERRERQRQLASEAINAEYENEEESSRVVQLEENSSALNKFEFEEYEPDPDHNHVDFEDHAFEPDYNHVHLEERGPDLAYNHEDVEQIIPDHNRVNLENPCVKIEVDHDPDSDFSIDADSACDPSWKECLLCGKRIRKSEPIQKLDDPTSNLTEVTCSMLGVSTTSFEAFLPKVSFCYKCIHRLTQVRDLESQKAALDRQIHELKTLIHMDFRQLLNPEDDELAFLRNEPGIRQAIIDESSEFIDERGAAEPDEMASEAILVKPEWAELGEVHDKDRVEEHDPLDMYHDESEPTPVAHENVDDEYPEDISLPSDTTPCIPVDGRLPVLELKRYSFDLTGAKPTGLFTRAALIKRRKLIRNKRKELLKKSKMQVVHPETGELVEKLKCPYEKCTLSFAGESRLQVHIRRRHEGIKNPEICDVCGRSYKFLAQLKQHKLTHTGNNNFKCSQCNKEYKTMRSVKIHEEVHRIGKRFICITCGKGFSRSHHLVKHQNVHKPTRFKCDFPECSSTFVTESQLLIHKRRHEKPEKFKCELCDTIYRTKQSLEKHIGRVHECKPPRPRHLCRVDDCKFSAARISELAKHRLDEHGVTESPKLKCHLCPKMLASEITREVHLKMHANDLQFKCRFCAKAFAGECQRSRHEKLHGITSKDYICEICGKGFTRSSYLRLHRRTHFPKCPGYIAQRNTREKKREQKIKLLTGMRVADLVKSRAQTDIDFTRDRTVPYFEDDDDEVSA